MKLDKFNIFKKRKEEQIKYYNNQYIVFVHRPSLDGLGLDEDLIPIYLIYGYVTSYTPLYAEIVALKTLTNDGIIDDTNRTIYTSNNNIEILYSSQYLEDVKVYYKQILEVEPYKTWNIQADTKKYNL